jgi:hypothetical protein
MFIFVEANQYHHEKIIAGLPYYPMLIGWFCTN